MRLALLALVIAAPAFAVPAPAKVASACPSGKAKKVTACSALRRVTAELQACGGFDFVDIYTPGPTDRSVLTLSEKIALVPDAKGVKPRMGAPKVYKGKTTELTINWTTAPDPKTGGHHGKLSFGSTKSVDVVCNMVK